MVTAAFAQQFALEWIEAWNAHDVERILQHYNDDFEMTSPFIAKITGHSSGTLRGKKEVGAYWRQALGKMPDLHFTLQDVGSGENSICIRYRSVMNLSAVEWLHFGSNGKVIRAMAHYCILP